MAADVKRELTSALESSIPREGIPRATIVDPEGVTVVNDLDWRKDEVP